MSLDLLTEISENWRLEAKEEDNNRYFYYFPDIPRMLNGQKTYVVGRKRTGKTAISEYIANLDKREENIYTEKLKFKNFPSYCNP